MEFVNDDLRKDIQKILMKHKCSVRGKSERTESKLIDDIEKLFEDWYDMRITACLV